MSATSLTVLHNAVRDAVPDTISDAEGNVLLIQVLGERQSGAGACDTNTSSSTDSIADTAAICQRDDISSGLNTYDVTSPGGFLNSI